MMFQNSLRAVILVVALATTIVARADEFDTLRLKWRDMLTQGTNSSRTNPLYSNWIAQVESTAQSYLNSFDTSIGRTNLFYGYSNLATDSSDITTTYEHLRALALAYAVPGSMLEGNAALLANIISGLDWMHAHFYNPTSVVYDNWYDFEIAVPRALNDTVVLLYSNLSPAQISNYMSAIDHFSPTPSYTSISSPVTGYNKVWKSLIVSLRGVIVRDSAKIVLGRTALSDVFPNVTSGEGFYADGSFIFHDKFAYNTGYGVGLLDTMGSMMQLLQNSSWPITDPAQTNVFRWVFDTYAPFIVRGSAMDMTSGRYPSRNGDNHERGHELLGAILRVAQVAPPADAAAIKSFLKAAIQSDTSLNFLNTQFPPYNVWANDILTDANVTPRAEVTEHRQFPGMDRVVHRTPNWTFGLSMSSKRVANYETTRSENLHGWFTGEGMTYLYNNDLTHYAGNFWATVDPYRLPGTTVDTITRTNGSGDSYNSPNNHVGGASILGRYGVAVMHLNAYGTGTMSARNSWFMFDNEIVCVGNSISSSYGRETIIENRRLDLYGNNPFMVNGVAKPTGPGWSETMSGTSWAHLAGSSPGADIGYYFPTATTVKALRESRSGRFYDANTTYGSKTPSTGNYLTMYLDHGSNGTSATYSYVLLPGMSPASVAAYAASPEITVVQNNSTATAVKKDKIGVTAANFWKDSSNQVAGISSDHKAAVILRNDGNVLDIGISDPTQTNNAGLRIEIISPALSVLSAEPGILVLQLAPTIKLLVSTSNKFGATLSAKFLLNVSGQRPTVMLSTPCDKNMDAPATVTLSAAAQDPDGTIARFDFYSSTTSIAQVFAPSTAVTNVTVPNLLPGAYNFTVVAVDNSGLMATSGPVSISVYTPKAVGQGTGLIGEYYKDTGDFRTLSLTRTDTNIDFSWSGSLSHPIPLSPHFCVRWMGRIQARRSGLHKFHTETDEGGRLWIDGRLLINDWDSHPASVVEDIGSISLVAGRYYDIRMEFYEDVDPAVARLYWTQPGGAKEIVPQSQLYPADRGLKATYYYATNMTPTYAQWVRVDDTVNFVWGTNSPEPTILFTPFAARWTGKVRANAAGTYSFFTLSDDAARLYVNGQLLINNWTPHTLTENSGTINLPTAGQYYDVTMEYFNAADSGTAVLSWQPPGEMKQVIPSSNLTPHQDNKPPALSPITNMIAAPNSLLTFAASAADPDATAQSLIYSLDAGAPGGATVNPTNGVFSWTPSNAQAGGNYNITLRVTDTGSPAMSEAQSFTVVLNAGAVCGGYRGDVNGDGAVTVGDWVLLGRFAAGTLTPSNACQFALADCATNIPCGDGEVTVSDWVKAGRYASGSDPWIAMSDCPPVVGDAKPKAFQPRTRPKSGPLPRTLSITNAMVARGTTNCFSIVLSSQGDENALGFSLHFDTNLLTFVSAKRGVDAVNAPYFIVNTLELSQGLIGLAFLLEPETSFPSGARSVVDLCFWAKAGGGTVTTPLAFLDLPVVREISDPFGSPLPANFDDGEVILPSDMDLAFKSLERQTNGAMVLTILGQVGVWEIQNSTNLIDWRPISRMTNTIGKMEYLDMINMNAKQRFYRAVKQ